MTTKLIFNLDGFHNRTTLDWCGGNVTARTRAKNHAKEHGCAGMFRFDDSFTLFYMDGDTLRQRTWAKAVPVKMVDPRAAAMIEEGYSEEWVKQWIGPCPAGESVLAFLGRRRVFDIEPHEDKFIVTEGCNGYYNEKLTKDDMLKLADEIRELAQRKPDKVVVASDTDDNGNIHEWVTDKLRPING